MDIYKSIFYLTIYLIIFGSILTYTVIGVNKQYIIDNWPIYRCNPLVMPFAGLFGFDSATNMSGCLNLSFNSYFSMLIRPFQYMIDIIKKIIRDIIHQLDSIRTILRPIRDFFAKASSMVFKKVEAVMGTVIYSFLKINDLMKRIFGNFRLAVYTLEASQMTVRSVWDGPIGQSARFWAPTVDFFSDFFCFSEDTLIDGVAIKDIRLDKHIEQDHNNKQDHNNIYGMLEVYSPKTMYLYNGVEVSGNHLVLHNNRWTRVSSVGRPVESTSSKIYSLYTKDHRITINNTLFCDYEETDLLAEIQKRLVLKRLTSMSTDIVSNCPNLVCGNTPIKMASGDFKTVSSLEIGEELYESDTVLGIVKQRLPILSVNGYSINNIILHNNKWILLSDIVSKDRIVEIDSIHYNIITRRGYYYSKEYIIRDYLEVHDIDIYNKIADCAIHLLNSDEGICL
jgi:hypothetical protein